MNEQLQLQLVIMYATNYYVSEANISKLCLLCGIRAANFLGGVTELAMRDRYSALQFYHILWRWVDCARYLCMINDNVG